MMRETIDPLRTATGRDVLALRAECPADVGDVANSLMAPRSARAIRRFLHTGAPPDGATLWKPSYG